MGTLFFWLLLHFSELRDDVISIFIIKNTDWNASRQKLMDARNFLLREKNLVVAIKTQPNQMTMCRYNHFSHLLKYITVIFLLTRRREQLRSSLCWNWQQREQFLISLHQFELFSLRSYFFKSISPTLLSRALISLFFVSLFFLSLVFPIQRRKVKKETFHSHLFHFVNKDQETL